MDPKIIAYAPEGATHYRPENQNYYADIDGRLQCHKGGCDAWRMSRWCKTLAEALAKDPSMQCLPAPPAPATQKVVPPPYGVMLSDGDTTPPPPITPAAPYMVCLPKDGAGLLTLAPLFKP